MGMKLLTTLATKDKQQDEVSRKLIRIQEIEKLTVQVNANLARAEADFNATLARNRSEWEVEEQEHVTRVRAMESEILDLEDRKEQALIPIEVYKQQADTLLASAQDAVTRVTQKEDELDELREILETRLTDVNDQKQIVEREAQRLAVARQGIEEQQKQIQEGSQKLTNEMQNFALQKHHDEQVLTERKNELSLAEINFNAKHDKYLRDVKALQVWERQLIDERDTLVREFDRLKKKGK